MRHFPVLFIFCILLNLFFLDAAEYSRITMDSIVVADGNSFYIEELDAYNRPFESSSWTDGTLMQKTTWLYEGLHHHPYKKIKTTDFETHISEYDVQGNEIFSETTNAEDKVLQTIVTSWNTKNLKISSEHTKDTVVVRTEYFYNDLNELIEKKMFKDGLIQIVYSYPSENEIYESLYKDEKLLIVIYYRDGVRIRNTDAKDK